MGKLYDKGIWSVLSRFQTHRFCFVFKEKVIHKFFYFLNISLKASLNLNFWM